MSDVGNSCALHLVDNRYSQNPIEPTLPRQSGKRVGQVRNHALFDDLTDFLLMKACNPCRKVKAKCDGVEPCSRCTEKGVQCDYLAIKQTKYVHSPLIPG
jgi:Fungal Zn(2)-Cys(6) binuclear cluster domain